MPDLGQLCGMIGARLFAVRAGLGAQVSEFATKAVHVLASFLRGCVRCRGLRFGAGLCELSFGGRLLRSVNLLGSCGFHLRDLGGGAAADILDRRPCLLLGVENDDRLTHPDSLPEAGECTRIRSGMSIVNNVTVAGHIRAVKRNESVTTFPKGS